MYMYLSIYEVTLIVLPGNMREQHDLVRARNSHAISQGGRSLNHVFPANKSACIHFVVVIEFNFEFNSIY